MLTKNPPANTVKSAQLCLGEALPTHQHRLGGAPSSRLDPPPSEKREEYMTFVKRIAGAAAIGAVLTAGMLTGARAAAIYTAIDLNPSGFTSSVAEGIGDGQQVGFAANGGPGQAILWTGTAASALNLNPSGLGLPFSSANGVANGQQVGSAFHSNDNINHAILWTGTAASAVDLTPSGFIQAAFAGIADGQQVGFGVDTSNNPHALLWTGTAASAVDLNPSGFTSSFGEAVGDGQQVGFAVTTGGNRQALLWTGTAASALNLTPSGFPNSEALGVGDGQQVGYATPATGVNNHAILWTGTAASAVDLNPNGFTDSIARGVANGQQVGQAAGPATGSHNQAFLWTGTAASAVDLNTFLPAGFTDSEAGRIDENGDIVGLASGPATAGNNHAFLWEPVAAAVPGSARYPAGATAAITKIGVPGAPPPPLIRPPTASIIPDRSRQWSAEGETEKAAGGCPEFQVSHICRYAASRSRVNRAMSKRGMVDRFRVSFCRRPSSNPGSVASRSARVS